MKDIRGLWIDEGEPTHYLGGLRVELDKEELRWRRTDPRNNETPPLLLPRAADELWRSGPLLRAAAPITAQERLKLTVFERCPSSQLPWSSLCSLTGRGR